MDYQELKEPTPELSEAFMRIYDKTCTRVRGKLLYDFGEGDPTDDLFQETYTAIWEVLLKNGDEKATEKQVFSIAKNKREDHFRRIYPERKKVTQLDDEDSGVLKLEESNEIYLPGALLTDIDRREEIRKIVSRLPEQQKIICKLHNYERCSVKEIAAQLGIAEGTVKAHLSKGRDKIKKELVAEAQNGNRLYGGVGTVALGEVLRRGMEQSAAPVPVELTEKIMAANGIKAAATAVTTTAGATEAATAATTTAAGTSAATTITTGAGIMGKIAALTVGTKAAIATAAAVLVVVGGGSAFAVYRANEVKQAEAAAIVQQQEEQARLDAEQAAKEAAELKAKEEEAARKAEAEQLAAKAEAERKAAEEAEAQAAAQAAQEQAEAEEAAREAQEQAAAEVKAQQEQSDPIGGTTGGAVSGPNDDGWNPDGLPGTGPTTPSGGGTGSGLTGIDKVIQDMGGDYIGKPEPSGTEGNKLPRVKNGTAKWDSSVGGWVYQDSFGRVILFPNGNSANMD